MTSSSQHDATPTGSPRCGGVDGSFGLVAFDFDGTLADSYGWLVGALNRLAPRHGFRAPSPAEEPKLRQLSAAAILRRLGIAWWKRPRVARALRQLMAREIDQIRLFPGIPSLVQSLRAHGLRLAIVSSNAPENIASVLGECHFGLFERVEAGLSLGGKATSLRALRRRYRLAPGQLLYIGDEVRDLEAARAAKAASGAVAWGYNHPDALRALQPDFLFECPEDIARVLTPHG
ncbi:Phosphoglycolate phosphatase [Thiorhodovibrio winogradskyi]|uniref:Phosphoglycolate phosphatase n=1 Tax=Thiorhodovibrio winogradskyi TaxID=77007 RepID=A0ABZ0S3U3_9GAMM|nr:HAD hydrolase-like protein [Thiorhodovibrio winogradskyi]